MFFDCPKCKKPIDADNELAGTSAPCPHCRKKIIIPKLIPTAPSSLPSSPLSRCPDCGGKVSIHAPVCPHCGRPFESQAPARHLSEPMLEPNVKYSETGCTQWIVYVALGLFIVFVITEFQKSMKIVENPYYEVGVEAGAKWAATKRELYLPSTRQEDSEREKDAGHQCPSKLTGEDREAWIKGYVKGDH